MLLTGHLSKDKKYLKVKTMQPCTVNSEVSEKVLILRKFADAKFRENNTLAKWQKEMSC